jgi:hypothetical protein
MTTTRNHREELAATLANPADVDRFMVALQVLRRHLVHTREVPNGLDFLFSGPENDLHIALRTLTEIERHGKCGLHIDYVRIEAFFLLRILGSAECQDQILSFFDGPPIGS